MKIVRIFTFIFFLLLIIPQTSRAQMKFRAESLTIEEKGETSTVPNNALIFIEDAVVKILDAEFTQLYYVLKFNPPETTAEGEKVWKIDCSTDTGGRCILLLVRYSSGQSVLSVRFRDMSLTYLVELLE